jgi:excisionase family DNA binding protein
MAQESTLLHNISSEQFFSKLNELKKELSEKTPITQQVESVKEELMTPEEVAMYFKRHKDTIENWTKKGYLIKYGIGRAVYYKRSEVESAIIPL